MITASEAKILVENSEVEINRICEKLDKIVVELANAGQCTYAISAEIDYPHAEVGTDLRMTKKQQALFKKLQSLGYTCRWAPESRTYEPRGLYDGVSYQNWMITIGW